MQVAELFVSLAIKGQDKAVSALVSVEHGLKGLASVSLEAKAAILAAMYGLEQLFQKSGAHGTSLTNLNAVLGVSTKTLQQYDYAARQVGVSNAETEGSFKALQSAMTKTALGKGAPEGLAQVAMLTGGISAQDVNNFMKNPEALLQRLQQYAQKEKRVGIRDEVLKSFGLGDNMIAAVSRNAFRPDVLKNAPVYNDNEVKALDKANIGWSNLTNKIEMAVGHLNAAHGGQLVKDFSKLVDLGLKFSDILLTFAERMHVFEGIEFVFDHINAGAQSLLSGLAQVANLLSSFQSKNNIFKSITDGFAEFAEKAKLLEHGKEIFTDLSELVKNLGGAFKAMYEQVIALDKEFKIFDSFEKVVQAFLQMIELALKGLSGFAAIVAGGPAADKVENGIIKSLGSSSIGKSILNFVGDLPDLGSLVGGAATPKLPAVAAAAVTAEGSTPPAPGASNNTNNQTSNSTSNQTSNSTSNQNVTVNQTLNFSHEGKNSTDTGHSVKKAINDAFRQLNSQNQGS